MNVLKLKFPWKIPGEPTNAAVVLTTMLCCVVAVSTGPGPYVHVRGEHDAHRVHTRSRAHGLQRRSGGSHGK